MERTKCKKLMETSQQLMGQTIQLCGWIRNQRTQKEIGFWEVYDGTCFESVQVVFEQDNPELFELAQKQKVGACVQIIGEVAASMGKGQTFEIRMKELKVLGESNDDYPIQPKRHTREFLREQAHLRIRTKLFQAVFRVRSVAAKAAHDYFQERGFIYLHAPLFTSNDAEGAGAVFQATTLDLDEIAKKGKVDYSDDFFGKKTGLAVTGQLEGETFALAFSDIYTFGPSFRADRSRTRVHVAEFWHLEPEMAFCDLAQLMEVEEDFLKHLIRTVLEQCPSEMAFFDQFVEKGHIEKLKFFLESDSAKITYREAFDLLQQRDDWKIKPVLGEDFAKEHETYLCEEVFKKPLFVTDWPKDLKAFYMKLNEDGETVAAVDYLLPGCGEVMGGSQREDDYDKLVSVMRQRGMNEEELDWYLDLRRYGSCPHSGFGLGFDRLLMVLTGMDNIRDVIAYPRTIGSCDF